MRLALALTVLPAMPAAAAIDPCYLDQMVAEAVTVIQMTDHEVRGPSETGYCTLTGTVARSFRGDIAPGTLVETAFACANPEGLVGGTIYHDAETVGRAGAVEIHATAEGGPAGYGWGLLPIDAPTKAPAFRFEYLPEDGSC